MNKLFIFVFAALCLAASAGKLRHLQEVKVTNRLNATQILYSNGVPRWLKSRDGPTYYAVVQRNGNFAVYRGGNLEDDTAIQWQTNTVYAGQPPYRLTMQPNNNLELRDAFKALMWESGTTGQGVAGAYAIMQPDGNLVVYDGANTALWDSQGNVRGSA